MQHSPPVSAQWTQNSSSGGRLSSGILSSPSDRRYTLSGGGITGNGAGCSVTSPPNLAGGGAVGSRYLSSATGPPPPLVVDRPLSRTVLDGGPGGGASMVYLHQNHGSAGSQQQQQQHQQQLQQLQLQYRAQQQVKTTPINVQMGNPSRPENCNPSPALNLSAASNTTEDQPLDLTGGHCRKRRSSGDVIDVDGLSSPGAPTNVDDSPLDLSVKRPRGPTLTSASSMYSLVPDTSGFPERRQTFRHVLDRPQEVYAMHGGGMVSRSPAAADSRYPGIHIAQSPVPLGQLGVGSAGGLHRGSGYVPGRRGGAVPVIHHAALRQPSSTSTIVVSSGSSFQPTRTPVYRPGLAYQQRSSTMSHPSANSSLPSSNGRPMDGRFVPDGLITVKRTMAEPSTHFRSDYMLQQQQQQQQMTIPNVPGSAIIDMHRPGRLQSMTSSSSRPAGFTGRLVPVERRQPPNGLPPEVINQHRITTVAFRRRGLTAAPAEASAPAHVDPYVTPPPLADKPVMKSTYGKDGWQLNIPRALGGASNSISGLPHDVTFKSAPSDEVISGHVPHRSETIDVDSGVDDMYFRGRQPIVGLPVGERRQDDVMSCRRGGPSTDLTATATQTNLSISDELKNPPIVIQPIPEVADGSGGGDACGVKPEAVNSISGGADASMMIPRDFRGAFDRGVVMSLQGNSGLGSAAGSASTTSAAGGTTGPPSRRIPIANVQPIMKEPPALVPRPVGCSTTLSTQQPVVAPDKKDAVGADVVNQRPSLTTMDSELEASTASVLVDDGSSSMKDDIPLLTTSVAGQSSSSSSGATVSSAGSTSTTTSTTGTSRLSSHHMEYIKFLRQTVDAVSNRGGGTGSRGGRTVPRSVSTDAGARCKLQTSMSAGRRVRGKTVQPPSSVKARRQLLPQFSADLPQQDNDKTEITKQTEDADDTSGVGGKTDTVSEQQKSETNSSVSCASSTCRKAKTPVVYFDDEDSSTQATTLNESAAESHASTSQIASGPCDVTDADKTWVARRVGSKLMRGRGKQRAPNGAVRRRVVGLDGKRLGKGWKAAAQDRTKGEENHVGDMSDTTEDETSDVELKAAGRSRDVDAAPPAKRRKRRAEVDVANCKSPAVADGDAADDGASRDLHVTGNSSSRRLAVSVSRGGRGNRRQGGVTRGQRGGRSGGHVTYQRHHIRRGGGGRISHRGADCAEHEGPHHNSDGYDFNELDEENGGIDGEDVVGAGGDCISTNNSSYLQSRDQSGSSHCTLRGGRRSRPGGFQYPDVFGRRRGRGGTSAGRRLGRRAVDVAAVESSSATEFGAAGSGVDGLSSMTSSKHHHGPAEVDVSGQTVTSHDAHDIETETETASPTFPPSSFHPFPASSFGVSGAAWSAVGPPGRHRVQSLYSRRRPSLGLAAGRLATRPRGGGGGRGRGARAAGLGRRALKAAAAAGRDLEELALRDEPGETPLHKATRLDYEELVYYFLTTGGVPANAQDNEGRTPLHISCSRGNMNVTRMLLAFGAHPNCKASDGTRPIHCAVAGNHVTIVRLLLACGADVTSMTSANRSVLQLSRGRAVRQLIHGVLSDLNSLDNQVEIPWEFPCSFDKHRSDVFDDVPLSDDETEAEMIFDVNVELLLPVYRLQAEPSKPYHNYHRVCDVIRRTQVGGVAIGDDDYVILNGDLTFVRRPAPSSSNSSSSPSSSRDRHNNTSVVDHKLPWRRNCSSAADWMTATGDAMATVLFVELDSILRERLDIGSGVRINGCTESWIPSGAPSGVDLACNIPPSQPHCGSCVVRTRLPVTSSCRASTSLDPSGSGSSLNRSQSSLQPTVVLTPWNSDELCLTNSTSKCGVTAAADRRRNAAGRRRGVALHLSTSSGLDADPPSGTTVDEHLEMAEERPPPPTSSKTSEEESFVVTSAGLDAGRRAGSDCSYDFHSKISQKNDVIVDVGKTDFTASKTDSGRSSGSGTPSHSSSVTSLLYVQTTMTISSSVSDPTDETTQPSTPEPSTCSPATEPPTPTIEAISLPVLEKHEGGGDVTMVGVARRTISADVGGLFQLRQAAGDVGNDVVELDAEGEEMKGDKGFVDDDDREMPELTLYA